MSQAFIVMQIGNDELDRVCANAIVPAIEACGLDARRVDKHNEGGLLKSEIISFIQNAEIIVADLTNERPNVYLEIGYVMGVDKFRNLILTAREDHFLDSPNYEGGGPRVHFDLAGYDILQWSTDKLDSFRSELEKRIRRRMAILAPASPGPEPVWDEDWIDEQRTISMQGLAEIGRSGYMEVRAAVHPPKLAKDQIELKEASRVAPIHTFGWPIAPYFERDDLKPRPREDGIRALIKPERRDLFDYWAIRRNGDFYFLGSLFEDQRRPGEIFFNTRIHRVTESLLYLMRLYGHLGLDRAVSISVAIRHGGLRGRILTGVGGRELYETCKTEEEVVDAEVTATMDELERSLVEMVIVLVAPMFRIFDFFELEPKVYEDIVNRFLKGEVS